MKASQLGMSRYGIGMLSPKEPPPKPRSRSVLGYESADQPPLVWDRSMSDSFSSDRIVNKPLSRAAHFVAASGSRSKPISLTEIIESERNYLFGNNGPVKRPGTSNRPETSHRDEMSRFGSRLVSSTEQMSTLQRNALEFTREKENEVVHSKTLARSGPPKNGISRSIGFGLKLDTFTVAEPHNLFDISKNMGPHFGKKIVDTHATAAKETGQGVPDLQQSSAVLPMKDLPAVHTIDILQLYNIVVDGTVGHLIVDTRDDQLYDDCHVRGAIDLAEALTYNGRHIILVGFSSIIGACERHVIDRLESAERALSFKILNGGFSAFHSAYPFFCEPTASSRDEEFKRMRERRLHIYPSLALPGLYIGGIESATDGIIHTDLKLTHMISIIADPDRVKPPGPMCRQLKLRLRDEEGEDIASTFETTQAFLAACVAAGGRVLVHCKMGRSRSATLVLMWMVFHHGMTLAEAWRRLKASRRQIGLNAGFTRALIDFEKRHRGASTVSWSAAEGLRLNA